MKERITSATCRSCGACCIAMYDQEEFCDVEPNDYKRLPPAYKKHVRRLPLVDQLCATIDNRRLPSGTLRTQWLKAKRGSYKGYSFNACIALKGSVMHDVKCAIYVKRPDVCKKAVKPGDRTCRAIRREIQNAI